MRAHMMLVAAGVFIFIYAAALALFSRKTTGESDNRTTSVLDFTMTTIEGVPRPLSVYKGEVLMIVNTASKCGYTPQYATLEELYREFKDKGFRVLAFPANDFLWQEPGTNEEIKQFCASKYNITFDLFAKISVKGGKKHPLYTYITQHSPLPGPIGWNFQKYLVDRQGRLVARFASSVDPMSPEVRVRVEQLLAEQVR